MTYHQQLAGGERNKLSFLQQMGNIWSEVSRANFYQNTNVSRYETARERMLELLDLTLQDSKGTSGQKMEIARMREVLCDYFYGENTYHTDTEFLNKYFLAFGILANKERAISC